MTGANEEPKPKRVPRAVLNDAAKLVEFAYGIREAMPAEARRHLLSALEHCPTVLTALSALDVRMAHTSDVTAVVGWATFERNRATAYLERPIDTA